MSATLTTAPPSFEAAVSQIRAANFRAELQWAEIAAPRTTAQFTHAIGGGVSHLQDRNAEPDLDSAEGAGRLILLHDSNSVDSWGSDFRFVCYAQAPLELEMGDDPFIADVTWSWLLDALNKHGADYTAISGSATKTISSGYGGLAAAGTGAQLQIRASWTPCDDNFAAHAEAWAQLLCMMAGLPDAEGVVSLSAHRARKERV
ncbi:DUF3000 family protein [Canibacter zhoujuaniae]|uniref:DUF3000 family protein n=1 Tax=Canibacter zhoujuaniae TaxID=2708343 RepID=UPI0014239EDD|nr:DUF3000 family protein [Canibacter zhoujuaniae]